ASKQPLLAVDGRSTDDRGDAECSGPRDQGIPRPPPHRRRRDPRLRFPRPAVRADHTGPQPRRRRSRRVDVNEARPTTQALGRPGALVSCIVPAFNGERYLAEALQSILAQTYQAIEVIVADDGSSDATRDVAAAFGEPVRVVTQPTAGPPATRNL